jgi:hypothetical protein
MWSYIALGLGAALVLSLGGNAYLLARLDVEKVQVQIERRELAQCGARLQSILDDAGSDREIDNLPDSALRDVPPHWLLPPGDATGQ